MRWTPEEDARLLELLEQGLSGQQIGEVLGRTRGSVGSRANRIKPRHEGPPRPVKAGSTAKEPPGASAPAKGAEGSRRQQAGARPEAGARRERSLVPPARTCQYIGETKGSPRDWTFCGKPALEGWSYCAEHVAVCYAGKPGSAKLEKD